MICCCCPNLAPSLHAGTRRARGPSGRFAETARPLARQAQRAPQARSWRLQEEAPPVSFIYRQLCLIATPLTGCKQSRLHSDQFERDTNELALFLSCANSARLADHRKFRRPTKFIRETLNFQRGELSLLVDHRLSGLSQSHRAAVLENLPRSSTRRIVAIQILGSPAFWFNSRRNQQQRLGW